MQKLPILALAFSGGLDTTYCAAQLTSEGWAVHTVFVNTGGADAKARMAIAAQARAAGAAQHHEIDAQAEVYARFVKFLIAGNVLRGEVYPLSVAAERTAQAMAVIETARTLGAGAIAHGSTAAGNDQVRFDIAIRVLAPGLKIITPIRDRAISREAALAFLRQHNLPLPPQAQTYSVNQGLWGTTWGGGWTHDTWAGPPPELLDPPAAAPAPREIVIDWVQGEPCSLDGMPLAGPELIARLGALSAAYGLGFNIHVGETALGIKGRIGFSAGAALLLISAHRELEKLVLTKWQGFWKDQLSRFYGDRLHEGHYFDPVMRDLEACIGSSQSRVNGATRIRLAPGRFLVTGARSPRSLLNPAVATYGEAAQLWSGEEARAFAKFGAIPAQLARRAAGESP